VKGNGEGMNELIPIEHQGQRILTTAQLAESYGTETRRISENFNANKERYKEGKHFFLLQGDELKQFSDQYGNSVSVERASKLYLWTEKGAWLHAKSLNNDKAWDAYEMLVDEYYRIIESRHRQIIQTDWSKIEKIVKSKFNLFLLSGIPQYKAYTKALVSVELETGVDLSEFKPAPAIASRHTYPDLSVIIEALRAVMGDESNILRHRGDEYALVKESVYSELDTRGLKRKEALRALLDEGILSKNSTPHFAKRVNLPGKGQIRAIVISLDDEDD
jgi:hypothetical protein